MTSAGHKDKIGSRTDEQNMTSIEAVLFDFDGTLAPNLDLLDMRRQVANLTVKAGVPEEIFRDLYIVEIIVAGHKWLRSA